MIRWILSLLLLAAIGYGGWYAYKNFVIGDAQNSAEQQAAGDMKLPVEGVTLQPEPLAITISATGTLSADAEARLKAEIAGRVEKISFDEGSTVSTGQPLFEIDARSARANYEQAQASANLAEQNLARMGGLAEKGAIAATEFDQFTGNEKIAAANLRAAEVALDKATVRAPYAGTAGIRRVNLGDYVQPGQDLVLVTRADPVRIEFTVPEAQAAMVSAGQTISFTSDLAPDEIFSGDIIAIEPAIGEEGRQLRVLATADNPNGKLRPGGFVNISATVADKQDALLVPESALIPMGDQQMVTKVDAEGTPLAVPVKTGFRQAGRVEVVEGLLPGDSVITAGQMKLGMMPGAKVQIIPPSGAQSGGTAPQQPEESAP